MRSLRCALALIVLFAVGGCVARQPSPRPQELRGYRVIYRVTEPADGRLLRSREIVEVRRPYDGRVETIRDGEVLTGRITSRAHFWQLDDGGELAFGVLRPAGPPARDASFAALLDASDAGLAERIGSDLVLGRTCWWFAYRDPAPKPLLAPTDGSRVESCVDTRGIVLREVWALGGETVRISEAVELSAVSPSKDRFLEGSDPSTAEVTNAKGAELLGTRQIVRDVAEGRIESPFSFDKPTGWRRDRVSLVGQAAEGARPTQFLSQTFIRDDELVVVETGSSPQFGPPWPTREGRTIEIGAGEGRVVYAVDRVEIRLLSAIGYARVIAPSEALAMGFVRRLGA